MSESGILEHFFRARDVYRSNADRAVVAGEYRKASELLWGALAQQLKAFAATCNVLIQSHRDFFDFLRRVSKELDDPSLYEEFAHLNALHRNFYDEVIPPDLFPGYYQRTTQFISKLEGMMKQPH